MLAMVSCGHHERSNFACMSLRIELRAALEEYCSMFSVAARMKGGPAIRINSAYIGPVCDQHLDHVGAVTISGRASNKESEKRVAVVKFVRIVRILRINRVIHIPFTLL